jgi:Aminotransferase class-V
MIEQGLGQRYARLSASLAWICCRWPAISSMRRSASVLFMFARVQDSLQMIEQGLGQRDARLSASLAWICLSLAGHKLYAPKGVGALYVRKGICLEPLIHGAGHESGRRAGTENILLNVALGTACDLAQLRKSSGPTQPYTVIRIWPFAGQARPELPIR